jgi:hypothetical protein
MRSPFRTDPQVAERRAEYRAANNAQQDYAATSGNDDENDPTYLALNAHTNETRRAHKAAKRAR